MSGHVLSGQDTRSQISEIIDDFTLLKRNTNHILGSRICRFAEWRTDHVFILQLARAYLQGYFALSMGFSLPIKLPKVSHYVAIYFEGRYVTIRFILKP